MFVIYIEKKERVIYIYLFNTLSSIFVFRFVTLFWLSTFFFSLVGQFRNVPNFLHQKRKADFHPSKSVVKAIDHLNCDFCSNSTILKKVNRVSKASRIKLKSFYALRISYEICYHLSGKWIPKCFLIDFFSTFSKTKKTLFIIM